MNDYGLDIKLMGAKITTNYPIDGDVVINGILYAPKQPTPAQEPRSEPEQGIRIGVFKVVNQNGLMESSISIEELARLLRNVDYSRADAIPNGIESTYSYKGHTGTLKEINEKLKKDGRG